MIRWLVSGPRTGFTEDWPEDSVTEAFGSDDSGTVRTLTLTADREDVWLYECAKRVISQVSRQHMTHDESVTALLAVGGTALLP